MQVEDNAQEHKMLQFERFLYIFPNTSMDLQCETVRFLCQDFDINIAALLGEQVVQMSGVDTEPGA